MEYATNDPGIAFLQAQSLALAELASELIRGHDKIETADPLPTCHELMDIALSLLIVEPVPRPWLRSRT